jgi:hypothetical protein
LSWAISENDAERLLSMEKNVAGLDGTRFAIGTMGAKLMAETARFCPAPVICDNREDIDVMDGNESSDEESSDIGDDADSEDL